MMKKRVLVVSSVICLLAPLMLEANTVLAAESETVVKNSEEGSPLLGSGSESSHNNGNVDESATVAEDVAKPSDVSEVDTESSEVTEPAISPETSEATSADSNGENSADPIPALERVPAVIESQVRILDVPIISQLPMLPTGCEATAVTMLLNYKGVQITKEAVANEMPYHDSDPNLGYVGDPYTTEGFTIYPPAFRNLVTKYAGSYTNLTGTNLKDLEHNLKKEKPVVVWVVMHGFTVHAITLTGYDANGFYFNDPWTGAKNSYIDKQSFSLTWNQQERRALTY
ncbi:C39 family peptidase [Carnobacterium gallinarum]|uniref:C39 family peptidase n=1 Tax=Carnobacterium gallinarum TaxID=2749 RepID=UPI00068F3D96|nr:C39 family peptidase [Carnobacterium gallinarum]